MRRGDARWSHDPIADAYYFAPVGNFPPPYLKQVHMDAIVDVAADGTLAGIELLTSLPPPPETTPPPPRGAEADKAAADAFVALNVDQTANLCERVLVLYPTHPLIQRLAVECRGVCRSHQNMDSAYKAAVAEVEQEGRVRFRTQQELNKLLESSRELLAQKEAAEAALAEANRQREELREVIVQIHLVAVENAPDTCVHKLALDFVRQIASKALGEPTP